MAAVHVGWIAVHGFGVAPLFFKHRRAGLVLVLMYVVVAGGQVWAAVPSYSLQFSSLVADAAFKTLITSSGVAVMATVFPLILAIAQGNMEDVSLDHLKSQASRWIFLLVTQVGYSSIFAATQAAGDARMQLAGAVASSLFAKVLVRTFFLRFVLPIIMFDHHARHGTRISFWCCCLELLVGIPEKRLIYSAPSLISFLLGVVASETLEGLTRVGFVAAVKAARGDLRRGAVAYINGVFVAAGTARGRQHGSAVVVPQPSEDHSMAAPSRASWRAAAQVFDRRGMASVILGEEWADICAHVVCAAGAAVSCLASAFSGAEGCEALAQLPFRLGVGLSCALSVDILAHWHEQSKGVEIGAGDIRMAVPAAHFGLSMVLMVASVFLMQPTLVGTAVCGE